MDPKSHSFQYLNGFKIPQKKIKKSAFLMDLNTHPIVIL